MKNFRKILIANRGEIAVRIIKTCRRLNIPAGVVYAEDDKNSLHVQMADEAFSLGSGSLADTYLDIDKIVEIGESNFFDAIHPGYGFLSENPALATACAHHNITFIGPSADIIALMGDKIASKELAAKAGVPVLKPLAGSIDVLIAQADSLEFPVIVKAAAGGGGKGMRIVHKPQQLKEALISTSREALAYFGDERVFVEQYIQNPRHIEIQVLADQHGDAVALFERECTLQRRHQKVIEEAPSPTLTPQKREEMMNAALRIVEKSGYTNAGTIEFLVSENLDFYFLEMNTRIQVEHPVTEMITGKDLVEEQISVAKGEKFSFTQDDLQIKGHSIECRIYAEDPENDFRPSPGTVHYYQEPASLQLRIDAAIAGPAIISSSYDPMIAKIVAFGKDREDARKKMKVALEHYHIHGITTNIAFQHQLISHADFIANKISTHFIEENLEKILSRAQNIPTDDNGILLAAFAMLYEKRRNVFPSVWEEIGYWRFYPRRTFRIGSCLFEFLIPHFSSGDIVLEYQNKQYNSSLIKIDGHHLTIALNGRRFHGTVSENDQGEYFVDFEGNVFKVHSDDNLAVKLSSGERGDAGRKHNGIMTSPMPGKVLDVHVREGEQVNKHQKLITLEAMKMENQITAPFDGHVEKIYVNENDKVDAGNHLVTVKQVDSL